MAHDAGGARIEGTTPRDARGVQSRVPYINLTLRSVVAGDKHSQKIVGRSNTILLHRRLVAPEIRSEMVRPILGLKMGVVEHSYLFLIIGRRYSP